jgi:hypothetical protein
MQQNTLWDMQIALDAKAHVKCNVSRWRFLWDPHRPNRSMKNSASMFGALNALCYSQITLDAKTQAQRNVSPSMKNSVVTSHASDAPKSTT